jgi:hypothetical protein
MLVRNGSAARADPASGSRAVLTWPDHASTGLETVAALLPGAVTREKPALGASARALGMSSVGTVSKRDRQLDAQSTRAPSRNPAAPQ